MALRIEYLRSARKTVDKLDPQTRKRIRDFLYDRLAVLEDPRQLGKALTGPLKKFWSYRVGDQRVICDIQDGTVIILVVTIGDRKEVYRS